MERQGLNPLSHDIEFKSRYFSYNYVEYCINLNVKIELQILICVRIFSKYRERSVTLIVSEDNRNIHIFLQRH